MILGTQVLLKSTHPYEREKCSLPYSLCKSIHIVLEPLNEKHIRTNSIDVHLGRYIKVSSELHTTAYYVYHKGNVNYQEVDLAVTPFILEPKAFVLGMVHEYLSVPISVSATLEGRSSVGRFGLFNQNAGRIEGGYSGNLTCELFNAESFPILLEWKMPIGQLVFSLVKGEVTPYSDYRDSKYQLDIKPEPSKLWM